MTSIEYFIEAEESKMGWLDRAFNNYPVIETTTKLASSARKIAPKAHVIIRPSISQKIAAMLFLCPAFLIGFILTRMLFIDKILVWIVLGMLCFLSALIYMALYFSFFDKKTLFTLFIDYNGIVLGNTTFGWSNILETYIMKIPGGKMYTYTLMLHTKTDGFKTYNMYKFSISMHKLSALIEHYKTNANLHAITPNII